MQQVREHCYPLQTFSEPSWFIFIYVDISNDNSDDSKSTDFLMSCARFFPSAPSDSLSTLIHPILCPRRLILMGFIKELPVSLVSENTREVVENEVWALSPSSFRGRSTHLLNSLNEGHFAVRLPFSHSLLCPRLPIWFVSLYPLHIFLFIFFPTQLRSSPGEREITTLIG